MKHEGIDVYSVLSGKECLESIKNNPYDIIFMDIMMPDMDGVETMQKLKNIEGFCTPIVALTADAQGDAKTKYLSLGFDGYIAKPIIIDELRNVLKTIKNIKTNKND